MSFTLTQIQRKQCRNKVDFRKCYAMINNWDILSNNVKLALKKYLNYRLKQRRTNNLFNDKLEEMIKELLECCCNKDYLQIGLQDVVLNENEILYQIKKAIYYGATKHIYSPYDNNMSNICGLNLNNLRQSVLPPKRITQENLSIEQVQDYFAELEVI